MNFLTYQPLALRTSSVFDCDQSITAFNLNLLHAHIGLTTEIAELFENEDDHPNRVEEVGDVFWYLNLGFYAIGLTIADAQFAAIDTDFRELDGLVIHNGRLGDLCKRAIFYKQDDPLIRGKIAKELSLIFSYIKAYCEEHDISMIEAMELNIAKLKLRFPTKFDGDLAVNRDTAAERAVFE